LTALPNFVEGRTRVWTMKWLHSYTRPISQYACLCIRTDSIRPCLAFACALLCRPQTNHARTHARTHAPRAPSRRGAGGAWPRPGRRRRRPRRGRWRAGRWRCGRRAARGAAGGCGCPATASPRVAGAGGSTTPTVWHTDGQSVCIYVSDRVERFIVSLSFPSFTCTTHPATVSGTANASPGVTGPPCPTRAPKMASSPGWCCWCLYARVDVSDMECIMDNPPTHAFSFFTYPPR
jgi:hypothetical protein